MFNEIGLWDFLSFGGYPSDRIPLNRMNVLVGPNGSGKSNLIEAFAVLRSCPDDLPKLLRSRGGFDDWRWKGARSEDRIALKVTLDRLYTHEVQFKSTDGRIEISSERIEGPKDPSIAFRPPVATLIHRTPSPNLGRISRKRVRMEPEHSVLSQLRHPKEYPANHHFIRAYRATRIYRDWEFGPSARVRQPVRIGIPGDFLNEDATNLAAVLHRLNSEPDSRIKLLSLLAVVIEDATDLRVVERDGYYDWGIAFSHTRMIPGWRLSDGTLRWLCLAAVLINPGARDLICIEEPELGLHPDMIQTVASMLKHASERCQIIVTTHSTALVGMFSDTPQSLMICENVNGRTILTRLDRDEPRLKDSLLREDLGLIWSSGAIGGNRW